MKKNVLLIFLLAFSYNSIAQQFQNIVFTQGADKSKITITYDFEGEDKKRYYDINVYLSKDGGQTFEPRPLKFITGDLAHVKSGKSKEIVWDAAREYEHLNGFVQFHLEAVPKPDGYTYVEVVGTEKDNDKKAIEITVEGKFSYFIDPRDNKRYKTVKIGEQTWMAENLAYKSDIGYYAYNNKAVNAEKYGYLYNWQTAKKICPTAWYLPTKEDFDVLLKTTGSSTDKNLTTLFENGESGFNALLGGWQSSGLKFHDLNYITGFWSTSLSKRGLVWFLRVRKNKLVHLSDYNRFCTFYVRCLKK